MINFLCARESGESYMKGKISNCMNDPSNGKATMKAVGSKPPTLKRVLKDSVWLCNIAYVSGTGNLGNMQ